jgi:acetolactate synthase-1/2/3 large subunit
MRGAEFMVRALEREGVDTIFGFPGGAILQFYDALYDSKLHHILVRHEQAAAFAADAYARVTGKVGVCVSTSGPGATNLVTGIANAYLDSIPVVAITGQVDTASLGTDAFQEVDTLGITLPVVKHSFSVRSPSDLPWVVSESFRIARSGRPGPVLIELPKDVASTKVTFEPTPSSIPSTPASPEPEELGLARSILSKAKQPVVYAGGGIAIARVVDSFRRFVEATDIPTVATLKGLGCLPWDHPRFLGMLGMHGHKGANLAIQNSDLLVVVGARFDDRVTGKLKLFAPKARVIHLDADPSEIGRRRAVQAPVKGDLKESLEALTMPLDIDPWRLECTALRDRNEESPSPKGDSISVPNLFARLSLKAPEAIVTCDVGQHQMWVAQNWRVSRPERHLSSSGLGAMGYGLPAAVGAQIACPDRQVINVTGDGSFMMNVQELATVNRYKLPIKIVVMDNSNLGMVRQWQELFFDRRYSETNLSDNPDFAKVAEAFGVQGFHLVREEDVEEGVERLLNTEGPVLMHVSVDPGANVWPIVPPGKSNTEMMEGVA